MIKRLTENDAIKPPKWLPDNVMYECMMGSVAYGVSSNDSDVDIYGFCIPPLDMMFPHLRGEIPGFGTQLKRFEQFQEHHVEFGKCEFDLSIYSIVKYFQLCMQNNPNMIDSLFVPSDCVLHNTPVGLMVRDKRKMFLHKGAWHKFRGYAYSQMSRLENKTVRNFLDLEDKLGVPHDLTLEQAEGAFNQSSPHESLNHLTDEQLEHYYEEFAKLTKRQRDAKNKGSDTKFLYHIL